MLILQKAKSGNIIYLVFSRKKRAIQHPTGSCYQIIFYVHMTVRSIVVDGKQTGFAAEMLWSPAVFKRMEVILIQS